MFIAKAAQCAIDMDRLPMSSYSLSPAQFRSVFMPPVVGAATPSHVAGMHSLLLMGLPRVIRAVPPHPVVGTEARPPPDAVYRSAVPPVRQLSKAPMRSQVGEPAASKIWQKFGTDEPLRIPAHPLRAAPAPAKAAPAAQVVQQGKRRLHQRQLDDRSVDKRLPPVLRYTHQQLLDLRPPPCGTLQAGTATWHADNDSPAPTGAHHQKPLASSGIISVGTVPDVDLTIPAV